MGIHQVFDPRDTHIFARPLVDPRNLSSVFEAIRTEIRNAFEAASQEFGGTLTLVEVEPKMVVLPKGVKPEDMQPNPVRYRIQKGVRSLDLIGNYNGWDREVRICDAAEKRIHDLPALLRATFS